MNLRTSKIAVLIAAMGIAGTAFGQAEAIKPVKKDVEKQVEKIEKKLDQTGKDITKSIEKMKSAKKFEFGQAAPEFELIDSAGKKHVLSEYVAAGNVVVLEWFNPQCPAVIKHYNTEGTGTTLNIQKELANEKVVWLRINSGSEESKSSGKEYTEKVRKDWKIASPVLLDMDGKIGRKYGARVTPEMFIINREGVVAYHGAIDSDPSTRKVGEELWVRDAVRAVIAGETVEKPQTKAVGCSIKYAPEKKADAQD